MSKKWYEEQWRVEWAEMRGWLDKGLMPSKTPIRPYVYVDADFKPVYRKTRWDLIDLRTMQPADKTFTTHHSTDAGATWSTGIGPYGGDDTILMFQLKALLWARKNRSATLFWTEGEKDARNILQAGWGPATSHWQGGSGARYGQAMWLAGAECMIALGMDRDKVGRQIAWHHAALLSEIGIGGDQVIFVQGASKKSKADLTDHLELGLGRSDLEVIPHHKMASYINKHGELGAGDSNASGNWGSKNDKGDGS